MGVTEKRPGYGWLGDVLGANNLLFGVKWCLRAAFAVSVGDILVNGASTAKWLASGALFSLAGRTVPFPPPSPIWDFVPVHSVVAVGALLYSLGPSLAREPLGFSAGDMHGWPLLLSSAMAVCSTVALAGWSLWWVRGDHGPVQKRLAIILGPRPWFVLPLAMINAVREEIEFRCLYLGALIEGLAGLNLPWVAAAIFLHALYFAAMHVSAGFPSGAAGGLLVLIWGGFLGWIRWWTGGMTLVYLLHVQADVVIFVLVLIEEHRRKRRNKK